MNWTVPEIEGNLAEQIEDAGNCTLRGRLQDKLR